MEVSSPTVARTSRYSRCTGELAILDCNRAIDLILSRQDVQGRRHRPLSTGLAVRANGFTLRACIVLRAALG